MIIRIFQLFLASSLLLLGSYRADAQQVYPTRPVKLVVPYAAGTSPDVVARLVADKLQPLLGQPVVIDNRVGAAGMIGAEAVAHSTADGYTLLLAVTNVMAMNPHVYSSLKYNALKDFRGVSLLLDVPFVLTAAADKPYTGSFRDLLAEALRRPGAIDYASVGVGSHAHVVTEWLSTKAGVRMNHVPYASNPATDLMAGRVDIFLDPILTAAPLVKANKVRALAVSSAKRSPLLPDVPTIGEVVPGIETYSFQGIFAPAGTPDAVVERLSGAMSKVLRLPEVQTRISEWGYLLIGGSGAELDRRVRADSALYGDVIRAVGIHAN